MRPKSTGHLFLFLAGLACFALPFFDISCVDLNGAPRKIASVEGYKLVIGGDVTIGGSEKTSAQANLAATATSGAGFLETLGGMLEQTPTTRDKIRQEITAMVISDRDAIRMEGGWRGRLAMGGLLAGLLVLLARLPFGNALAGFGGLTALVGMTLLVFDLRSFEDGLQIEVAYGLVAAMVFGLLGMVVSWRMTDEKEDP